MFKLISVWLKIWIPILLLWESVFSYILSQIGPH